MAKFQSSISYIVFRSFLQAFGTTLKAALTFFLESYSLPRKVLRLAGEVGSLTLAHPLLSSLFDLTDI
jgi:hypothetical protein